MSVGEKDITDEQFYKKFERTYQNLTLTGKAPWLNEGKIERDIAYNPASGVIFKGVNALMLEMSAAEQGFKESRWISEAEIRDLKLKVRNGQQPTPIAYVNRYVHATDVHPSTGKAFDEDHPKQKYYYMYNIEQLKEYSMIRESGMTLDKSLVQEKIRSVVENTKTNKFPEILDRVSMAAEEKVQGVQAKVIAQELARYRMTQEFRGNFVPQAQTLVMKDASIKTHGAILLTTLYHAEVAKDRFISRGMNLENDKVRTVARSRQQETQNGLSL
jgi:Antirestriction protein